MKFQVEKGKYSKLDDFNYYYGVLFELFGFKKKPIFNDRTTTGIRCGYSWKDESIVKVEKILNDNEIPFKWVSNNRVVIETKKLTF